MIIRLVVDRKTIHIIELQRRTVNKTILINGQPAKKVDEESFQGLILNYEDDRLFRKTLKNYLEDIRYAKGVVSKLVPQMQPPVATFSHRDSKDTTLPGLPSLLNALKKLKLSF